MGRAEEHLDHIPVRARRKNSPEDVRRFLDYPGNPDRDRPTIHVAGINGKGSACVFLTSILREAGYSTGTFISPRLVEVRERFLISGGMVNQEGSEGAFETVLKASRELADQGLCHPTFFEFPSYMVMVLFGMRGVDMMVLETGMGSRLDVINMLEQSAACVITSISMDRTKYLGDTLAKTAGEKADIIKTGVPPIFGDGQPEISTILKDFAFRRGAARYPVGRDGFHVEEVGEKGLSINARVKDSRCLELEIPFETFYQAENVILTVYTLDILRHPGECSKTECRMSGRDSCICPDGTEWGIPDQHIIEDLKNTFWPDRMGQVRPGVHLDGAHNPGGIEALIQAAGEVSDRQEKKPQLLFAAISGKDCGRTVGQLCREMVREAVGVVHISSDRGLAAEMLARIFGTYTSRPVYLYGDTKSTVWNMVEKSREGLLFCAGSLYLIGGIKAVLEQKT